MVHVNAIRALEDNFMYVVRKNANESKVLVVDPVNMEKIEQFVKENKLEVTGALLTHHHWDHAGGTPDFRKMYPNAEKVPIIGGDERIDKLNMKVNHDEQFEIAGLKIRCLHTPCHTRGHICYHITTDVSASGIVLTGDTLFIAGCGKFFEGSADEMHRNLNVILGALPDDTRVYPGHEYTASNLKFAHHIEPSNKDIEQKLKWAIEMKTKDEDTVPSSIGEEKKINPFMRVATSEELQKRLNTKDLVEGMKLLREAKNNFR